MRTRLLTGFGLFLSFLSASVCAEGRVALVIGNASYSEQIGELKNTLNDALAMRKLLTQLHFEVQLKLDLNKEDMVEAVSQFSQSSESADVALVFYSGHAVEIQGKNLLLPVDLTIPDTLTELERQPSADMESRSSEQALLREKKIKAVIDGSVDLELLSRSAKSRGDRAVLLIDACRDDTFSRMIDIKGVTSALKRQGSAKGGLYMFAAAPGEAALDGDGDNSPFTTALVKYFGVPGQEVLTTMRLVQQEVYDVTKGRQLPYIVSGMASEFIPNPSEGALNEREQLLLSMSQLTSLDKQLVERYARENDIPLAPLFASLIEQNLTTVEDKQRELEQAVKNYLIFKEMFTRLDTKDSEVERLKVEAMELMKIGVTKGAGERLSMALEINRTAERLLIKPLADRFITDARLLRLRAQNSLIRYERDSAANDLLEAGEIYRKAMALDEETDDAVKFEYKNVIISLVAQLLNLGRSDEALVLAQQSRAFFTDLAKKNPEEQKWGYVWSETLLLVGRVYEHRGDLTQARDMYFENLNFHLAEVKRRSQYKAADGEGVFVGLNRLGSVLESLGELSEALSLYELELNYNLRMLEESPSNISFKSSLAVSYSHVGDVYRRQGNLRKASEHFEHSREILEELVEMDPLKMHWKSQLTVILDRLGQVNELYGDTYRAIELYERAMVIRQSLIDLDTSNIRFKDLLASSRSHLGGLHYSLGNLTLAAEMYEKNVDYFERMVLQEPLNQKWKIELAQALNWIGSIYDGQGDSENAEKKFVRAFEINESLVADGVVDFSVRRSLSIRYDSLGNRYSEEGDLGRAMSMYKKSQEIMETLAAIDPSNIELNLDLIHVNLSLGRTFKDLGDLEQALEIAKRCLDISLGIVEIDPNNITAKIQLTSTYKLLAGIYQVQLDMGSALEMYERGANISSFLLEKDPNNFSLIYIASSTAASIASVYTDQSAFENAIDMYQRAQELLDRASEKARSSVSWKKAQHHNLHDLALVYEKMGEYELAENMYEEELSFARALVEENPTDVRWKAQLTESLNFVGRFYIIQGHFELAFSVLSESLKLIQELSLIDPSNLTYQYALLDNKFHMTAWSRLQGDYVRAVPGLLEAASILESARERGNLRKSWAVLNSNLCLEVERISNSLGADYLIDLSAVSQKLQCPGIVSR